MNNNLAAFSRPFFEHRFVPDGSEEANHVTVDVGATEELFKFCSETRRLPVGNVLAILSGHDFVLGHVVDERLSCSRVRRNRDFWHEADELLSDVHGSRFTSARSAYENDVEVRKDIEMPLWNLTLFTEQRRNCTNG